MVARTFLILLTLFFSVMCHAKTVTVATGEYPPWSGEKLPNQGFVNHVVSEAFASVDIEVEFVYLPWKRAFEEARKGRYDLTSYWFDSTERRTSMLFSDPVIQNRTVFFQRAEDQPITWTKLTDLTPYRMSATMGFTYNEEFYELIAKQALQVTMVPTDIQNLKMLMSKRVDLMATDEMSGFYMAAELSLDPRKLRVLEPAMTTPNGYLMAGKTLPDSQKLLAEFNRGLNIIKQNGKYDQIINRLDNTSFYNPAPRE